MALFFGLVAASSGAAGCPGHGPAACTAKGASLPLAVAILLAVAGLAAHLLPPVHLTSAIQGQGAHEAAGFD